MLDDALNRAGNIGGGFAKGTEEEINKRADGPYQKAVAALGIAGAKDLVDRIAGEDRNVIPPQYLGNTDIPQGDRNYWDTDKFANTKLFDETVINDRYRVAKNHPMLKSMFIVDFEFNQDIANDDRLGNTYPKSMSFLLKNMSMPKAAIETEKINAYNVRKVIPKNVNYEPVNCTFGEIFTAYRSGSNEISLFDLFKQYMSYYNNDFVRDGENLHPGFASGRTEKQFIDNISIYFFWADGARKIRLRNPMIREFDYEDLTYENDEQLTMTCQIEYEYLDMHNLNITYDEFVDSTSRLLGDIQNSFKESTLTNPYLNEEILQPGLDASDDQRNVNLDGPAGQILTRLTEIGGIDLTSDLLNSDNAIVRNVTERGLGEGLDIAGDGIGAGLDGLDGLL